MTVKAQIKSYINSLHGSKMEDMQALHKHILKWLPKSKLWFLDGKDEKGKVVSNPNIGYGSYTINYADGTSKAFYQVGLSANTSGISVYIMGIKDKTYLPKTFSRQIGKATVTGYCIRFKTMEEIDLDTLEAAIRYGVHITTKQ